MFGLNQAVIAMQVDMLPKSTSTVAIQAITELKGHYTILFSIYMGEESVHYKLEKLPINLILQ